MNFICNYLYHSHYEVFEIKKKIALIVKKNNLNDKE